MQVSTPMLLRPSACFSLVFRLPRVFGVMTVAQQRVQNTTKHAGWTEGTLSHHSRFFLWLAVSVVIFAVHKWYKSGGRAEGAWGGDHPDSHGGGV